MEKIGLINIRVSYENDESISTEVRLSEIMKKLMESEAKLQHEKVRELVEIKRKLKESK